MAPALVVEEVRWVLKDNFSQAFTDAPQGTCGVFVMLISMEEEVIQFNYHARYYVMGRLDQHTKGVWFVLHGYGQLARFFGKKFEGLVKQDQVVVIPEGLSRFYLEDVATRSQGGSQRVGATWMTRENRQMDIHNYLTYLTEVYTSVMKLPISIPVTILGFSQGAATATRWAVSNRIRFDRLVLWAGMLPEDMDFQQGKELLTDKEIVHVYGTQDVFITDERFHKMKLLAEKLTTVPRMLRFEGGHEIHEATLLSLV
jgi:predicted esterase